MDPKQFEALKRHVAGAIVQHKSTFDDIPSLKNDEELPQEFIDKWVNPFYMKIGHARGHLDQDWFKRLSDIKCEITPGVIEKNLGDFNWRTRQTGAFFAAITEQRQFVDVIGTHLLKSEVCYAGGTYCKVLAYFNTERCVEYLNIYLEYYLKRSELWFDQMQAMEAVKYLDEINGTDDLMKHLPNWTKFIENKHGPWLEEIDITTLQNQIGVIEKLVGQNC